MTKKKSTTFSDITFLSLFYGKDHIKSTPEIVEKSRVWEMNLSFNAGWEFLHNPKGHRSKTDNVFLMLYSKKGK